MPVKFGGAEIIIILVIVILLFGAKKLPELARSLGSSAREFRKGVEEGKADADDATGQAAPNAQTANTTTAGTEA